jgi:hypothetical protein
MRMPSRRATFWSASLLTAATVGLALPVPAASAAATGPAPAPVTVNSDVPSPVAEPLLEAIELVKGLTGR